MIKILNAAPAVEKEPLVRYFGFKGGSLTELWQSIVHLESDKGHTGTGLATQSVLWSDPRVFSAGDEQEGNALMHRITQRALEMINGESFSDPMSLLDGIFDELYAYGRVLTRRPDLYKTFVLNALVALDNAAWQLYAREKGIESFDQMIPQSCRAAFSHRHNKVTSIPVIAYGASPGDVKATADAGYFFMKIKIGHPGTQQEMLAKDKAFLGMIHEVLGPLFTPYTENHKILYYLDANGRYESRELLRQLLDYLEGAGILPQVAVLEEPFPPGYEADVSDLGVRIAADESAHTLSDALTRMEMGYGAIALKAVAKTLSMTLKIAQAAYEKGVPCFCADLTAGPVLLEWNKNVAARLFPFPGLDTGMMETNGEQHYRNWNLLCSYSPSFNASWTQTRQGMFELDEEYYKRSGGIFEPSPHYEAFF